MPEDVNHAKIFIIYEKNLIIYSLDCKIWSFYYKGIPKSSMMYPSPKSKRTFGKLFY